MTTLGWYVHHHGAGHRTRFLAVRPHLAADVVVFSSLAAPSALPDRTEWITLPRDDDGVRVDPTVRGLLHWAPLGHRGHRTRLATIVRLVEERRIDAVVVDVSVEVTLLMRLLGIAVVVVAQPGERTDAPHALAYGAASLVVAPWAEGLLPPPPVESTRAVLTGGISRFDGRPRAPRSDERTVFVLGDTAVDPPPGWTLSSAGWTDDPWPALCAADVVVSAAGQNAVADLAAVRARAVVVPQPRPFGEQRATGSALAGRRLAIVARRADDAAIEAARSLCPDWSVWGVEGAAGRAAAAVERILA